MQYPLYCGGLEPNMQYLQSVPVIQSLANFVFKHFLIMSPYPSANAILGDTRIILQADPETVYIPVFPTSAFSLQIHQTDLK